MKEIGCVELQVEISSVAGNVSAKPGHRSLSSILAISISFRLKAAGSKGARIKWKNNK